MLKKIFLVILILFFVQIQNLLAGEYQWDLVNALAGGDFQKVEGILRDNIHEMSASDKRLAVNFALTYTRNENTLAALDLLAAYGIRPGPFDLYHAFNKSLPDTVVQRILDEGVKPNGEILLAAAEKKRFNFVKKFIEAGVDVNYRYALDKPYADGMNALLHAASEENFEIVKLLVEHGANVNIRAKNGSTAASIAYEKGQTAIYNYLVEHGAQISNSLPPPGQGQGIAGLLNGAPAVLSNGTYRLSGGNIEIKFAGNSDSGNVLYTNKQGKAGSGFFRIEGNIMTIVMENTTLSYRIDSPTSFSGNGETWTRTGN